MQNQDDESMPHKNPTPNSLNRYEPERQDEYVIGLTLFN
jgi:hypothetical protein